MTVIENERQVGAVDTAVNFVLLAWFMVIESRTLILLNQICSLWHLQVDLTASIGFRCKLRVGVIKQTITRYTGLCA